MQVEWWWHSNPTCCNQIYLNILHSQVVGTLKHLLIPTHTCLCSYSCLVSLVCKFVCMLTPLWVLTRTCALEIGHFEKYFIRFQRFKNWNVFQNILSNFVFISVLPPTLPLMPTQAQATWWNFHCLILLLSTTQYYLVSLNLTWYYLLQLNIT